MRRRIRVWLGASLVGVVLSAAVLAPAQSDGNLLPNGGFELGTQKWAAPVGATLGVNASVPPIEGASAALLTSTTAGTMSLASQYWETAATPGWTYALSAFLRDNEAQTSSAQAKLAILGAGDVVIAEQATFLGGSDSASFRALSATVAAPGGALWVRVTFTAQASAGGAHLSIDGVSVTGTLPPPPPPPLAIDTPNEAPPSTATASPASTPVTVATPRVTTTRTPTPIPTPTATPVPPPGFVLRNADFAQGTTGWSVTRGRMSAASMLDGQGQSLVLTAEDSSTVWVQQTVAVTPRGWFAASALLAPFDGIEAAWLRIAWYASADGSGAQLSTEDSPAVTSATPTAMVRSAYEVVSTGPVQAPAEAHSARVRILLRATTERGAAVAIDDVTFAASEPAEAAPPSPAARVQSTPSATPIASPTPPPRTASAPTPEPADDAPTVASDGVPRTTSNATTAAQRRLRITEIVSDTGESGADGDFEWIEVMNTGGEAASLAGISLRDRRTGNVLPPYTLDPGTVVVIAAPGANIPDGVPLIRLRRAIGNGLGNTGDRVALVAADGREIDAVAYGEGAEEGDEPLPAPGPGQSLERLFSPAGLLLEARVTDSPTPGVAPEAKSESSRASRGGTAAGVPSALTAAEGLAPSWLALIGRAGGLLLGAGAVRAASVARGRDIEA